MFSSCDNSRLREKTVTIGPISYADFNVTTSTDTLSKKHVLEIYAACKPIFLLSTVQKNENIQPNDYSSCQSDRQARLEHRSHWRKRWVGAH